MSVDPTAPSAPPAPGETLPCGAEVDAVVEQAQSGRAGEQTEHQRRCGHCRAALEHYARVLAPLQVLAGETVRAPHSTIEEALAAVRPRGGSPAPPWLVDTGRGRTRVGERVVLACARRAAERVPGVRAALVHAGAGVDDGVVLEVVLAAAYGADLRALGERVRRAVADEVAARTGVVPASVSALVDTLIGR